MRASAAPRRWLVAISTVGVAMLGMLAVLPQGAHAAKFFDSFFPGTLGAGCTTASGCTGTAALGGFFSNPRDITVNDPAGADGTGADGRIYVVDQSNNRVQAFDANKNFEFAIGRDVVAPGGTGNVVSNEQQTVTIGGAPTGGTFQLRFGGTAAANTSVAIPWDASPAVVQAALEGITAVGAGNVSVASSNPGGGVVGGPYTVTFQGARGDADVAQMTSVATGLTPAGGKTVTVATTVPGANSFEKCTVASQCKGGLAGTLGGMFDTALGVAVDQVDGHFYVRERNNNRRVQEFTAGGQFVRAFGWDVVQTGTPDDIGTNSFETCFISAHCKGGSTAAGTELGRFGSSSGSLADISSGIAVAPPGAPNEGELYVVDPGNRRLLRFTVPSQSDAAVIPDDHPAIGGSTEFGSGQPLHVATDAEGVVYVPANSSANDGIARYDTTSGPGADGGFIAAIPASLTGGLGPASYTGLEVDADAGRLFASRASGSGSVPGGVLEFDVAGLPETIDSSRLLATHGAALLIGNPQQLGPSGIGLNPVSGELLITTAGAGLPPTGAAAGHRVLVLDDDGVDPPPTVELLPPTNVGSTTATLQANINPNGPTGFPTRYRFQVSTTGLDNDWHDVAAEQLVGADGDGGTPVFINDVATGLQANSLYRVRVVTNRSPDAGTAVSAELTFATDPQAPKAETISSQHVTATSAQLVGLVNANGYPATYWFEWGDDNYGNRVPVPAASATGSTDKRVAEAIHGLDPESVYHFRLCAQNSLGLVCGDDRTLTTRAEATPDDDVRAYEMVTAPDKVLRRGGESTGGPQAADYRRLQGGLPASDGDAAMWALFAGATGSDADYGSTWVETYELRNRESAFEIRRRDSSGWHGEAVTNIAPPGGGANAQMDFGAISADLKTSQWAMRTPLFTSGSQPSTRVMGDGGGPRGGGWYPWLDPAWLPGSVGDSGYTGGGSAAINDDGTVLAATMDNDGPEGRDVTGTQDPLAPRDLTPAQTSGRALFKSGPPDWAPHDLVNECTGTVGDAPTLLPTRDDGGTDAGPPGSFSVSLVSFNSGAVTLTANSFIPFPADIKPGHYVTGTGIAPGTRVVSRDSDLQLTIDTPTQAAGVSASLTIGQNAALLTDDLVATRDCAAGSPTDVGGGFISSSGRLGSTTMTTMSDEGDRIFFLSPDLNNGATGGQNACASTTEAATACPAQLFVRQYADDGDATVRWLSRAEDALSGAPQGIGAFGNGTGFEGASRDGSVVYFRTNAPLLEDDPNGGLNRLTSAATASWDLYRYELGSDNNGDPATGDPGDRLTRVSGGPDPDAPADPNTNCTSTAAGCGGAANGAGGAVRFMSDNGERVYFVTAAQIPGASNGAPSGASPGGPGAAPTGTGDQINTTSRNLYLYDAAKTGADAYEFVAKLPFSSGTENIDGCATFSVGTNATPHLANPGDGALGLNNSNCVHGTRSGDAIVFETRERLTADDVDDAVDIYLYDATADALTRVTAPPPGSAPYVCQTRTFTRHCNGDMGMTGGRTTGAAPLSGLFGLAGSRHWNIAQDEAGGLEAIYFESRLPLTEEDDNAEGVMDVYEWRDGQLSLVSPGKTADSAFYSGNSPNGRDVFFWTEQPISAWEIDAADGDLYDARRGGGVPDPPAPPAVCDVFAGACHGGPAGEVSSPTTTTSPAADDNEPAKPRTTLTVRHPSAKARKRAARNGQLALSVRAATATRISAVATARLGGRATTVGKDTVQLRRPGGAKLQLRLSRTARRALANGKPLRLTVRVTATGMRARTITVGLPGVKR